MRASTPRPKDEVLRRRSLIPGGLTPKESLIPLTPERYYNGKILIANDVYEAIALSNDYAPEHLELHVKDSNTYMEQLTTTVPYLWGGDHGIR